MTDYASEVDEGEMVGEGVIITCKAGGTIAKGRFVKMSDATDLSVVQATAKSNVLGVAMKAAVSGDYIPVLVRGITKMTLGTLTATLVAGAAVCSNANGKAVDFADQSVNEGGTATYTVYYNAKAGIGLMTGVATDNILVSVGK